MHKIYIVQAVLEARQSLQDIIMENITCVNEIMWKNNQCIIIKRKVLVKTAEECALYMSKVERINT